MPNNSALSVVARIAYLSSDVVVESQPKFPRASPFAETYNSLSKTTKQGPTVISLPNGADPGSTLLRNQHARLISFTTLSSSQVLMRLVPHMAEISRLPVVLHIAVNGDLSNVFLLRSAVPFFFLSTTTQHAHDNALLASKLARTANVAALHVFYEENPDDAVEEVAEDQIQQFIVVDNKLETNGHQSNGTLSEHFRSYELFASSTASLVRRPLHPLRSRGSDEPHTVILILGQLDISFDMDGVKFVSLFLFTPLPVSYILNTIPLSATRVIVIEQLRKWSMKWTPLYLEIVDAMQTRDPEHRPAIHSGLLGNSGDIGPSDIMTLIDATTSAPSTPFHLGIGPPVNSGTPDAPHIPRHETSYTKILSHLFGDRLQIANSPSLVLSHGEIATSPEYALGRVRGQLEKRADLIRLVQELLEWGNLDFELHSLLSQWMLARDDGVKGTVIGAEIVERLQSSTSSYPRILSLKDQFTPISRWIIGSDAWSYDLGSSGLHHAIASGLNINILILDTLPYSVRNLADPNWRKHDVGLYAMNHGDVYVASVAVYSSYSQVLQALIEADHFNGPSVVLAYLPYQSESTPALEILKETKLAVDAGYWPLYRWDPSKEREGKEPFTLDSDAVKNDLRQFLDRQNHLSQLVRSQPQMATELVSSLGENLREARKKRAQKLFDDLLTNLDAPPLLVLYASDGGKAEKVAKRLANRGKARGLATTISTIDSTPLEELSQEEYVVFVTSVAGQGEPPQNARKFFKAINAAALRGEKCLTKLRFSVFGMGDSHYWPRAEDAHFYNKPGKDLNIRLEQLGGTRIADLGLGDDQDADGPETGYKIWEPLLWKALGVDKIEVTELEPDPITNEHIKAASRYLRGTIAEGLSDASTGALAPSDGQLTKFHGIYQQDDRDIRDEREAQGIEPAYSFMIRVRMPGGVCTPQQWLQMDQIADEHGCGTFKITTRQTFQFHGVIKKHLKPSIQAINAVLLDTLAACGDVNR